MLGISSQVLAVEHHSYELLTTEIGLQVALECKLRIVNKEVGYNSLSHRRALSAMWRGLISKAVVSESVDRMRDNSGRSIDTSSVLILASLMTPDVCNVPRKSLLS